MTKLIVEVVGLAFKLLIKWMETQGLEQKDARDAALKAIEKSDKSLAELLAEIKKHGG